MRLPLSYWIGLVMGLLSTAVLVFYLYMKARER